jgi:hypothetical protein
VEHIRAVLEAPAASAALEVNTRAVLGKLAALPLLLVTTLQLELVDHPCAQPDHTLEAALALAPSVHLVSGNRTLARLVAVLALLVTPLDQVLDVLLACAAQATPTLAATLPPASLAHQDV